MLQLRQGFYPIFIPLLLRIKLISITTLFKNLMVLNCTTLILVTGNLGIGSI